MGALPLLQSNALNAAAHVAPTASIIAIIINFLKQPDPRLAGLRTRHSLCLSCIILKLSPSMMLLLTCLGIHL